MCAFVCVEAEVSNEAGGGYSDGVYADSVVPATDDVRAPRALTAATAAVHAVALRAAALSPREAGARTMQAVRAGRQGGDARPTH